MRMTPGSILTFLRVRRSWLLGLRDLGCCPGAVRGGVALVRRFGVFGVGRGAHCAGSLLRPQGRFASLLRRDRRGPTRKGAAPGEGGPRRPLTPEPLRPL